MHFCPSSELHPMEFHHGLKFQLPIWLLSLMKFHLPKKNSTPEDVHLSQLLKMYIDLHQSTEFPQGLPLFRFPNIVQTPQSSTPGCPPLWKSFPSMNFHVPQIFMSWASPQGPEFHPLDSPGNPPWISTCTIRINSCSGFWGRKWIGACVKPRLVPGHQKQFFAQVWNKEPSLQREKPPAGEKTWFISVHWTLIQRNLQEIFHTLMAIMPQPCLHNTPLICATRKPLILDLEPSADVARQQRTEETFPLTFQLLNVGGTRL